MTPQKIKYTIRRVPKHKGGETWVIEYDRIISRVERVIIPMEEVDPNDSDAAVKKATEIMGCQKADVEVQT